MKVGDMVVDRRHMSAAGKADIHRGWRSKIGLIIATSGIDNNGYPVSIKVLWDDGNVTSRWPNRMRVINEDC